MPKDEFTPRTFSVVGTRPLRPDGIDKVTGRARYGADISAPGMLTGMVLRSPHAHARICSIDTSVAAAMPGVKAVITRADFPVHPENNGTADVLDNCMADKKALYDGHAVAAVAASSRRAALDALATIKVVYEVLPHVLDVDEAMKLDAPILHKGRKQEGVPADVSDNVLTRTEYGHGIQS